MIAPYEARICSHRKEVFLGFDNVANLSEMRYSRAGVVSAGYRLCLSQATQRRKVVYIVVSGFGPRKSIKKTKQKKPMLITTWINE